MLHTAGVTQLYLPTTANNTKQEKFIFVQSIYMGVVKTIKKQVKAGPSTFALLVDDINKMSESRQKLLWLQIHEEKVSSLAKELDAAVTPHNLLPGEIDSLIKEARKHGRKKKG